MPNPLIPLTSGQVILDRMELLHPELQVQPGEDGVVKALTAANMAQDYFESLLALHPQVLGDSVGQWATTAQQESSAYPGGLLRLDGMWRLDGDGGKPLYPIELLQRVGSHAANQTWPFTLGSVTYGAPVAAWTNGRQIFWSPIPDAEYWVRWYGLQAQADITASGPVWYPDICLTPLATFAAKVIRIGLDDSAEQLDALAESVFTPVIAALTSFRRDRPKTLTYSSVHST